MNIPEMYCVKWGVHTGQFKYLPQDMYRNWWVCTAMVGVVGGQLMWSVGVRSSGQLGGEGGLKK